MNAQQWKRLLFFLFAFSLLVLMLYLLFFFSAQVAVGMRDVVLSDRADRPLKLRLFYPTASREGAVSVGENRARFGVLAIPEAPALAGSAALVIFSHGSGGNLTNQAWLAAALAERGMIAVSLNHPGSTTGNDGPPTSATLWERPTDIRRTIDALLRSENQILPPRVRVDEKKIAVIGHSLGAFTALWSLGARFDPERYEADCRNPHTGALVRRDAF